MPRFELDPGRRSATASVRVLLLIALLLSGPGFSLAAEVTDLYSAEVPVAGQSAEQRTDGIIRAFTQMLVKVTGNRNITRQPELQDAIEAAPRYVQQYRYQFEPGQAEDGSRLLRVQFDAGAVSRLLRDRRLPVWGENRPAGLVWLGIESRGQRRLMRPEEDGRLVRTLTRTAEVRGLPLVLPLMDLEDQASLQVADLWGDFEQNIRRASERYSPDLIITGRMAQLSEQLWRVTWHLYQGSRSSIWSDEGAEPSQLASAGIERVTDLLAERYAPLAGEGSLSRIRLRVSGIVNLKQYASVGDFLGSQSAVQQLELIAVEPEAVIYDLQVTGGAQVLEQGLALGGLIEPISDPPVRDEPVIEGVDLYYRIR